MVSWIRRLWLWFKSLWSPVRRSGSVQVVESTGLDYENGLLALLEAVDGGLTVGNIKAILMRRGIKPEGLARWMRLEGLASLAQVQNREGLARRLQGLAAVATGELGLAAREVARGLTEVSQEEEVSVLIGEPLNQGSLSEVEKIYQLLKTIGASSNLSASIVSTTSTVQNAEFWFNQGCEQYERGDFLGAVASYDRAIQLNPDYVDNLNGRGNALFCLGRKEEAIASYDRAIQLNPDFVLAWFTRGNALYELGRKEEAIASYDRAIKLNPDLVYAWNNRGIALSDLGRKEEAIASYDRAIQLNPDKVEAWNNRGNALSDLGRKEEAIASYGCAIQINPDYFLSWSNRGNALSALGRKEEAIASYDRNIHLNPDDVYAWNGRGAALSALGRNEEAIASYDCAIQLNLDLAEAWNNRGIALSDLGRNEEAIASYDRAIHLNPDFVLAWDSRGIAAYNSCYNPLAQRDFSDQFQRQIIADRPILLRSLKHLQNDALENSLKQPPSLEIIQKLSQFCPNHFLQPSHPLNKRGYEGAINSYEIGIQTVSSDNGKGELHHAAGQAHYYEAQQSQYPIPYYQKAAISFENALNLLPAATHPEPHLEVIQSLIKLLLATHQPEAAEQQQLDGLEILLDLLNQQPTLAQKRRTEAKFNALRQLKIDILLQKGYPIKAIRIAELEKNRVLTHILDGWQETIISPTYDQIQTLLTPNSAIIYWHLTPHSLITFILKANQDPIIHRSRSTVSDLETWIKTWHSDYLDYRGKNKDKSQTKKSNHPWRVSLSDRLNKLGEILNIAALQPHINGIDQLLLVPHQNLHRFPLDHFFDCPSISTVPSLQIALTLQQKAQPRLTDYSLLSVENPTNDFLDFAEIESQIINRLFAYVTHLDINKGDRQTVQEKLKQNHQIFHFTGHGYHNFSQPEASALILKDRQNLTAKDISQLPLDSYQLICLAACETALNSPQNLDTEYVGLVSAFLKANASSVISTLWNTDEVSSAYLMINFYQRFLAGIPAAIALQQAKTWLSSVKYHQLAAWLENLKNTTPSTVNDLLEDAIAAIRQDPAKMESDEPPYAEPYYWATFIYSGLSHQ